MQSFLFYAKMLIFMHEPPIATPYLFILERGSTGTRIYHYDYIRACNLADENRSQNPRFSKRAFACSR